MNTQNRFTSLGKKIQFLVILLTILVLSSCSPWVQSDTPSCSTNMRMRVSINVTHVKPRVVFDQLARTPDCVVSVSPFVWRRVTLQVKNASVSEVIATVCQQIRCTYILNGDHLTIKPITSFDKRQARDMEERNKILKSRLPEGMSFEDIPLGTVLEKISKESGRDFKPWKDEGDRRVTIDVSGMTVEEAIKAVLFNVGSEGAVMIQLKYRFPRAYGQYWPWGYPPNF